jgi:hypothetical protein
MEQIRNNPSNTAHYLEEILTKLSLGALVIVNDNTKSEVDNIMKWLSSYLDSPITPFASTGTKIIVLVSLTGHELIFPATDAHAEWALNEGNA